MAIVIASVIVLSLIPLYLPSAELGTIDYDDGMFYVILTFIYLILSGCFVGDASFEVIYDTDVDVEDDSDLEIADLSTLENEVG